MSSVAQDDLSSLTNDQLRSRLLQYGLGNVPVTNSTRNVLVNKLRKTIEGQKSAPRRETIHIIKHPAEDEKLASKTANKPTNLRNTMNAAPMAADDIVPIIAKPKQNMRRSGRITPTLSENFIPSIAVAPSENDIVEIDEDPIPEAYVPPKRTSRSPSLGKSQTVVTSYKTVLEKPLLIVESTEEEEEEEEDDDVYESTANIGQNNIYPTLPTNGFKNASPRKTSSYQSALRRTTTNTTSYEPTSYQPLYEQNYRDGTFKTPMSGPTIPAYKTSSASGLNRRYTTSSFNSKPRFVDDDSATEHSDIDAPYLSDFTKRLSQLRPEPLDRKIIADVKQHHLADDSLWQSFSNLVIAFGRKFGNVILAGSLLMIVVFIYVFFIMA